MDGQNGGNSNNTIPEVIDLESGATNDNHNMGPNISIPTDEQIHGGNYFTNLLNEDGPLSPISTSSSDLDLGLDDIQPLNLSLFTTQPSNALAPVLGPPFGNANSIIDLNIEDFEGDDVDGNQEIGSGSANSSASGRAGNRIVSSSGVSGHWLEDNDGGEGTSDGRLLPCKRRAPEGNGRQLLLGESSRSAPRDGSSDEEDAAAEPDIIGSQNVSNSIGTQQDVDDHSEDSEPAVNLSDEEDPFKLEITNNSNTQGPEEADSGVRIDLNVTAQEENFERNIRFRSSNNQNYDIMPTNNRRNGTAANPEVQSYNIPPPNMLFPFDPVPSQYLSARINPTPRQSLVRAVNSPNTLQPVQLPNGVTMLPSAGPPASAYAMIEGSSSSFPREGTIEINLTGVIQQPSAPAEGSSSQGNNVDEEFEQVMSPTWHLPGDAEYAQTLSMIVSQFEARRQGSSAASRAVVDPFRSHTVLVSPLRPADPRRSLPEAPVLPISSSQLRNRMISQQIRNALSFMRSGGVLQAEDLMAMGRSALNGLPEEQEPIDDEHEDMRLDVDDMSYEELLHLEEQMGYVETGLHENSIIDHLARVEYRSSEPAMQGDTCCICQDEHADGESLGKLNCRHYFHYNCIKRWLMEKNVCPICKVKALDV